MWKYQRIIYVNKNSWPSLAGWKLLPTSPPPRLAWSWLFGKVEWKERGVPLQLLGNKLYTWLPLLYIIHLTWRCEEKSLFFVIVLQSCPLPNKLNITHLLILATYCRLGVDMPALLWYLAHLHSKSIFNKLPLAAIWLEGTWFAKYILQFNHKNRQVSKYVPWMS